MDDMLTIGATVFIEVKRKNAEIIQKEFPCRSFKMNFRRFFAGIITQFGWFGFTNPPLRDTSGNWRRLSSGWAVSRYKTLHRITGGYAFGENDDLWLAYPRIFDLRNIEKKEDITIINDPNDPDYPCVKFAFGATGTAWEEGDLGAILLLAHYYTEDNYPYEFLVAYDELPESIHIYEGDPVRVEYRLKMK